MRVVQLLVVSTLVLAAGVDTSAGQPGGAETSSIPLRYDSALIAKGFPSPVVRLSVGGHDALFLIDTGAGVHIFAAWFVAASGLPVHDSTASVRGSTGVDSRVRLVTNIAAALEGGATLDVREAAVVDFPPSFTENGIGGLLSPQLLAAAGQAAVLDLRVPSLRFDLFAVAAARLPRPAAVTSRARVCRNPDSPFTNRLFSVPVRAGGVDADLLLDSGATRTVVLHDSAPARAVESRSVAGDRTEGVGGAAQITRRVNGVIVERGDAPIMLDLTIGGAVHDCGPDGLLGMDALRECVAVLGDADVRLWCVAAQRR